MQLISVIQETLNHPPIPFKPGQQSLKAWVIYCLRNRGFKVDSTTNADFAIDRRRQGKVPFKTAETPQDPDENCGWIIWDGATEQVQVMPPKSC